MISLWVCRFIKSLPQRKSNLFWFILCQSSRHTGCAYLLQRVERFISNHFKDHFWQFVVPSVLTGRRAHGCTVFQLHLSLLTIIVLTGSIYSDNTLIQNIKLFKRLKDTWYRFLLLKQYGMRRSPGKKNILICHSRNRTGVKNKMTTYSALT